jgi:hypothetical protein
MFWLLRILCRHRIDFFGFNFAYTYRGGLKQLLSEYFTNFLMSVFIIYFICQSLDLNLMKLFTVKDSNYSKYFSLKISVEQIPL